MYSDTSPTIRPIYDQLKKLKPVGDDNMVGPIELINEVELLHCPLFLKDEMDVTIRLEKDNLINKDNFR